MVACGKVSLNCIHFHLSCWRNGQKAHRILCRQSGIVTVVFWPGTWNDLVSVAQMRYEVRCALWCHRDTCAWMSRQNQGSWWSSTVGPYRGFVWPSAAIAGTALWSHVCVVLIALVVGDPPSTADLPCLTPDPLHPRAPPHCGWRCHVTEGARSLRWVSVHDFFFFTLFLKNKVENLFLAGWRDFAASSLCSAVISISIWCMPTVLAYEGKTVLFAAETGTWSNANCCSATVVNEQFVHVRIRMCEMTQNHFMTVLLFFACRSVSLSHQITDLRWHFARR